MTINSANPYQNLALANPTQILSPNSAQKFKDFKEEDEKKLENLNVIFKTTYASEFGFRVDEEGFFEKDLNKMSKLPSSYSIHISTARALAKELTKKDENLKPDKIDLPQLLNEHYNALKAINPTFKSEDNALLTRSEISKLTWGFSTQDGNFEGKISRLYSDGAQLNKAKNELVGLNTHFLDNKITSFQLDKALNDTANNAVLKPYLTKNSELSKSGVLANFAYWNLKEQNDSELNFFMKPVSLDSSAHKNLYKILSGELKTEDFIKESNEEKMSFDLYLYVNGVDKKTTPQDKLSVFFQQYVNYQKTMDLKEFTNSSSIYRLYSDAVAEDFAKMRGDFEKQKGEEGDLAKINTEREQNRQDFLSHRQKQAKLNQILSSYFSVMS